MTGHTIIFDFDGTLTSGFVVDESGNFNTKLLNPGLKALFKDLLLSDNDVFILSSSESPGSVAATNAIASHFKLEAICGVTNKAQWMIDNGVWNSNTCYFGDDFRDATIEDLATNFSTEGPAICNNMTLLEIQTFLQENGALAKTMPLQTVMHAFCANSERIFIQQQFSMRSHKTGEYHIMADGNFVITRSWMQKMPGKHFTVTIPPANQVCDMPAFEAYCADFKDKYGSELSWHVSNYGVNAIANRKLINVDRTVLEKQDKIIAYYPASLPNIVTNFRKTMFFCNVSPSKVNPHFKLEEVADFLEHFNRSGCSIYFNNSQLDTDYALMWQLRKSIRVTNVFDEDGFMQEMDDVELQSETEQAIQTAKQMATKANKKSIGYIPYRVTDKDYDVENFVDFNNDMFFIFANPNDGLKELKLADIEYTTVANLYGEDANLHYTHRQLMRALMEKKLDFGYIAGNPEEILHSSPLEMQAVCSVNSNGIYSNLFSDYTLFE